MLCFSFPPFQRWRAPALLVFVHGGNAIIMSHLVSMLCSVPSIVLKLQFPFSKGRTFCMMCHSGCPPEQGIMSQLYASCPNLRSSIVTAWLSSQATKIFTSYPPGAYPNCKNRLDFLCPYDGNTILIEVCYSFGTPGSSTRLQRVLGRWWPCSLSCGLHPLHRNKPLPDFASVPHQAISENHPHQSALPLSALRFHASCASRYSESFL